MSRFKLISLSILTLNLGDYSVHSQNYLKTKNESSTVLNSLYRPQNILISKNIIFFLIHAAAWKPTQGMIHL